MAIAAPPRPRPRRPWWRGARRAIAWAIPVVIGAGIFGIAAISRSPIGQNGNNSLGSQLIAATATLGLTVDNIEVEGRETTDAATIMAALAAERGTPILSVSPSRAREQLQALPWVRS